MRNLILLLTISASCFASIAASADENHNVVLYSPAVYHQVCYSTNATQIPAELNFKPGCFYERSIDLNPDMAVKGRLLCVTRPFMFGSGNIATPSNCIQLDTKVDPQELVFVQTCDTSIRAYIKANLQAARQALAGNLWSSTDQGRCEEPHAIPLEQFNEISKNQETIRMNRMKPFLDEMQSLQQLGAP